MKILPALGLPLQLCILFLQLRQLRERRRAAADRERGRSAPPRETKNVFDERFQEGLGRLMAYDLAAARKAVQKHDG